MQFIKEGDNSLRGCILHNLLSELGYSSISSFQRANSLAVDGIFGPKSYAVLYGLLLRVESLPNFSGYFKQSFHKRQIVLHHSAGWDNARGMFAWWETDAQRHVATSVGITDDGSLFRGYDEQFWAFHLGTGNISLEQLSIGVEVCNWGFLRKIGDYYLSYTNAVVATEPDVSKVIRLNPSYKMHSYYERYTDLEVRTLKYWLLLNCLRFDIPLRYSEQDMWSVSRRALSGEAGIYTHNSYLSGKSDVSPQPHLISMLKDLHLYGS